jgi:hypothetical protein
LDKDLQKDKKNCSHFFKPLLDDLKRLKLGQRWVARLPRYASYATVLTILRHLLMMV